ncbi:DUF4435 domain-containing protein [Aureimonas altamirensis]|uniref:DUF4435 domain-containing protein n=1 Tax=Aureimonas altamirensis TaxID=370622 RepID=UPI0009DD53E8|nr:DUF4435 domain-containing protein [Aureimonas altamirensis]
MSEAAPDQYLARLKRARENTAVLKYNLATLRSHSPDVPVLAFEGPDDKVIYNQWVRRIRPGLAYEPFPCSGKKQVFGLRAMLREDLGNLNRNVYFFVDRDFVDMDGHDNDDVTFMTDFYATENYLVDERVLDEILKNEYHCHARPDAREDIIRVFIGVFNQFLGVTREVNKRLFIAKSLKLELMSYPPQRIRDYAVVHLDRVEAPRRTPEEIIRFKSIPSDEDYAAAAHRFEGLDPATRYRGKFALWFFMAWLDLLAADYSDGNGRFFRDIDRGQRVRRNEVTLGAMASRAQMPLNADAFIRSIQ